MLIALDQGWASAPDWEARKAAAAGAIDEAGEAGRPVILWPMARPIAPGFVPQPVSAGEARRALEVLTPAPWAPNRAALSERLADLPGAETVWFHDGLAHGEDAALMAALEARGALRLIGPEGPAHALTPPRLEEGRMVADILRSGGTEETARVVAYAKADTGGERRLAVAEAAFAAGDGLATAQFSLPPELMAKITRISLADGASAGGAALADGSLKRVPTGLVAPEAEDAVASLTSASHYLREALAPWALIREGTLAEVMETEPAALILADQGGFGDVEADMLDWVEAGGLMVRFAGPRLAASIGEAFGGGGEDPLLPVTLRRGGRVLGGALAWSKPRTLGPFDPEGPFRALAIPDEVDVKTQVLAEPSPDLAGRVWASLDDGTPLVTARRLGEGWVVLFHVTADAEWSSLPLSGLFVEMLGRVMALSPGRAAEAPRAEDLAGTLWRADTTLGPDGAPRPGHTSAEPVAGEALAGGRAGPGIAPGIYLRADEGAVATTAKRLAVNLFAEGDTLSALPAPPAGAVIETLGGAEAQRLGQWFLAFAVILMMADL
ncbi:MAG: LytTR family transcriptional regulator, partial [Pseudomonadota bacterium]